MKESDRVPEASGEVVNDRTPAVDDRAPVFFLSYARHRAAGRVVSPQRERGPYVKKFFDDLAYYVAEILPLSAWQPPGFMDTTMTPGVAWEKKLLDAASSCQVFVALLSDPYFGREWCAMEWDLFSRRRVVPLSGQDAVSGILPVLWAPIKTEIPEAVSALMRFQPEGLAPAHQEDYERKGILGLLLSNSEAYNAVVCELSMEIQRLYHAQRVEPATGVSKASLRLAFERGSP